MAITLLKNKIQLSKLKDFIGFIQQFINQTAARRASRKELRAEKVVGFYRHQGAGTKKEQITSSLWGGRGEGIEVVSPVDYLTSNDQEIPDRLGLRLHSWERLKCDEALDC